jgi:hypothetical protein
MLPSARTALAVVWFAGSLIWFAVNCFQILPHAANDERLARELEHFQPVLIQPRASGSRRISMIADSASAPSWIKVQAAGRVSAVISLRIGIAAPGGALSSASATAWRTKTSLWARSDSSTLSDVRQPSRPNALTAIMRTRSGLWYSGSSGTCAQAMASSFGRSDRRFRKVTNSAAASMAVSP